MKVKGQRLMLHWHTWHLQSSGFLQFPHGRDFKRRTRPADTLFVIRHSYTGVVALWRRHKCKNQPSFSKDTWNHILTGGSSPDWNLAEGQTDVRPVGQTAAAHAHSRVRPVCPSPAFYKNQRWTEPGLKNTKKLPVCPPPYCSVSPSVLSRGRPSCFNITGRTNHITYDLTEEKKKKQGGRTENSNTFTRLLRHTLTHDTEHDNKYILNNSTRTSAFSACVWEDFKRFSFLHVSRSTQMRSAGGLGGGPMHGVTFYLHPLWHQNDVCKPSVQHFAEPPVGLKY